MHHAAQHHDRVCFVCHSTAPVSQTDTKNAAAKHGNTFGNVPFQEAAKKLDVGLSVMKRVCRTLGLARWPYRTRASLLNVIATTERYMVGCLPAASLCTQVCCAPTADAMPCNFATMGPALASLQSIVACHATCWRMQSASSLHLLALTPHSIFCIYASISMLLFLCFYI